jgi:hypothetical protein
VIGRRRATTARIGFDLVEKVEVIDWEAAMVVLLGLCGVAMVGYTFSVLAALLAAH